MARRGVFMDGFAHYATADIFRKWNGGVGSAMTINSGTGRWGGNSLRGNTSVNGSVTYLFSTAPASATGYAIVAACVALKQASNPSSNEEPIIRFLDSNGSEQISLRINTSGLLIVSRNGTTLATAGSAISLGVFHHYSFAAKIDGSNGGYAVRMDGATVSGISDVASGANTRGQTNNAAYAVGLKNASNSGSVTTDYSDFVCCEVDDQVADILPDVKIECLYPSGSGTYAQFTPSSGSNYQTVDEATANTSDYNTSTADDQLDSFAMGDLVTASGTPIFVQSVLYAWRTDAAAKKLDHFRISSDAYEHASGVDFPLSSDGVFYCHAENKDYRSGGTQVDWTIGHFNGTEFGYKSRAG